ncbi:hypothetical protein D6829_01125 [Candidatus Pacearchaeota archaeon]|nr:MAG: hypothetical protein D6829_01125 [Candidatus Pacearchaeota archaeon]
MTTDENYKRAYNIIAALAIGAVALAGALGASYKSYQIGREKGHVEMKQTISKSILRDARKFSAPHPEDPRYYELTPSNPHIIIPESMRGVLEQEARKIGESSIESLLKELEN